MTFSGHIENGLVVFDGPLNLPDGTMVTVVIADQPNPPSGANRPTLYDRMKPIIGIADHLPPDASTKIDEVLYGRDNS